MIKVAGVWELGWNTPFMEYELWRMLMREFQLDEWYMTPVTGIDKGRDRVTETRHIRDCISLNPDFTPIFVDEDGDENLSDFIHPENALYILGKVGGSPKTKSDLSLRVETPAGKGLLWPHQILSIILYDRMKKSWQQ